MKRKNTLRALWFLGAVLASLPSACDTGGLVGGECRPGRLYCGGNCVDPETDVSHCGSCERSCASGAICEKSECVVPGGDGGTPGLGGRGNEGGSGGAPPGAGGAGDAGGDAGATSGGNGGRGGSNNNAGGSANAGAAGEAGAPCLPPFNSPSHCGSCDTQCAEPTPWCIEDGNGSYACSPTCPLGYTQCGDECVDTTKAAAHCGRCFNLCPSLRCVDGLCAGTTPGHVALFCMNYSYAEQRTAHTRLLGNALLLLPPTEEVRILAYMRYTEQAERSQVNRVLRWEAARFGRTYTLDAVSATSQVNGSLSLENYDVFLVYEQAEAPAGQLATVGAALKDTLNAFTVGGGVVIVLDGAQGTGEMPAFIDAAGLLPMDGHAPIALDDSTTDFYVQSQSDQLASAVVSPLSPAPYSCTFETSAAPSTEVSFVVTDSAPPVVGRPVVIHRLIAP